MAADDAPLQLKRPCRICQVARYAAIFAAIIIWYATVREPIGSETALPTALQRAKPVPIGSRALPDFSLTSHHGNRFGKSDLQDTWSVITIGYRACATDCPQTLAAMADARQSLLGFNASTAPWQWLMITLDPNADSESALADYLGAFGDNLIGLTGDVDALTRVVSVLTAAETPIPGQAWLIAPQGDIRAQFDPPFDADALTSDLRLLHSQSH